MKHPKAILVEEIPEGAAVPASCLCYYDGQLQFGELIFRRMEALTADFNRRELGCHFFQIAKRYYHNKLTSLINENYD